MITKLWKVRQHKTLAIPICKYITDCYTFVIIIISVKKNLAFRREFETLMPIKKDNAA